MTADQVVERTDQNLIHSEFSVGQGHEGVLEGGAHQGQLVQIQPLVADELAHRRGVEPLDVQLVVHRRHLGTRAAEQVGHLAALRRPDPDEGGGVLGDEVRHRAVGEDPAAADDDQVVGGQRHLRHEVAGDEHGAALGGQPAGQGAHPADALGVQPVDRLVEHDDRRVAEQRHRDAEPLAHAEGELADPRAGDRLQPDQAEHLVDPRHRDAVAGGQPAQVVAGGAAGVQRARLEQGADLAQRGGGVAVGAAVDGHAAGGRPVQPEDHAHRRRLAGAVGAEEAGHPARGDGEGDAVDGGLGAVLLGEAGDVDHGRAPVGEIAGVMAGSLAGRGWPAHRGAP
jgi:hypothetical protein